MPPYAPIYSLSNLTGTDGFRLDGTAAFDFSGASVSDAGDVNGDGYADLIIGAYNADPGSAFAAGSAFVVFGTPDILSSNVSLSTLDGLNGFRLNGAAASDYAGVSVSAAGDVNGDGYDDVIVGAELASPGAISAAGSSYVVFGRASGFAPSFSLSSLNGSNGFRIDGVASNDYSGHSVSSAGDVNGDGYDDVIVGAYSADPNGLSAAGASYVVFGKAGGYSATLGLASLDGSNGFRIDGVQAGDRSGISASGAGDVNGDGYDDIVIGAYLASPNSINTAGAAFVVFGRAGGFAANLNLVTLSGATGFRLDGVTPGDATGYSVSNAGDINGDGYDDIVVGADAADPGGRGMAGSAYVVFGRPGGFAPTTSLNSLDGVNGFRLDGAANGDLSGSSVSGAGDVNGDGFDDLLVGASGADTSTTIESGSSYVVFGRAGGFSAALGLGSLDGHLGFRLDGVLGGDGSGAAVSAAGDVNGDGIDDLMIGASYADPDSLSTAGSTYVVFGSLPSTSVNRVGSEIAQTIRGGVGDDTLSGLDGNDTLIAGDGDDQLLGGAGLDQLDGGNGDDTMRGGAGNDTLDGADGDNILYGDSGDDRLSAAGGRDQLYGGSGNDELSGSLGGNLLDGGSGDDTYHVGPSADQIIEGDGNGTDTVRASISYTLGSGISVEVMRTYNDAAPAAINLTGNEIGQTMIGGAGANRLDGGGGSDVMLGNAGNDTYVVDRAGDVVLEETGQGTDIVFAKTSYVLGTGQSVETLQLDASTGSQALNLTGNNLGNVLIGNAGANLLNGSSGADLMQGGSGNDSYLVEHVGDVVRENNGGGADIVVTSVSYTLGAGQYIETLQISSSAGAAALNLTGNDLANALIGNAGANTLLGQAGADTLAGGGARDTLNPGSDTAVDVVRFNAVADSTGGNRDIVLSLDFNAEDRLAFAIKPTAYLGVVSTGALNNGANFNIEIANAVNGLLNAGGAVEAVLFDPNSGGLNQAGHSYLVVDANNDGSYSANADYLVELVSFTGTLDVTDFV